VVVVLSVESREENFAFVFCSIELQVTIDVGVDEEVRRLGDDDLIVDYGNAERGNEQGFLHKGMTGVCSPVSVGVFEDYDAIAFGLAFVIPAIAHALGGPDASVLIDVDVCWIKKLRRGGPDRDFQSIGYDKQVAGNFLWLGFGIGVGSVGQDRPRESRGS
jgi:hypothetical protein